MSDTACTQCSEPINTETDNYVNFGNEEFSAIGIFREVCASCIISSYRALNAYMEDAIP